MKLFSKNKLLIKKTIKLYPLFWPKLYSTLRSLILPVSEIESLLPKTGSVLDVGCGYGLTTVYFAQQSPLRHMEGIELNRQRIKIAKIASKKINNIHFSVDDLANKQQGNYDAIVAIDLLHHLNQYQKNQLLSKCYDLLKPDGTLIIKDINTSPILKYIWNYVHDYLMTFGSTLAFLKSTDMIRLIENFNFKIITVNSIPNLFYPHIIYVFKKN